MSEELILLKEYIDGLGFDIKLMTKDDLNLLKYELKEAGEFGLADLVMSLKNPQELLDYVGEQE